MRERETAILACVARDAPTVRDCENKLGNLVKCIVWRGLASGRLSVCVCVCMRVLDRRKRTKQNTL